MMMHVNIRTTDGVLRLPADHNRRLMEVIRDNGLPMSGECGGACSCATCHVYVDLDWLSRLSPPDENESAILEIVDEPNAQSRLACQIRLGPDLDGITVALPAAL